MERQKKPELEESKQVDFDKIQEYKEMTSSIVANDIRTQKDSLRDRLKNRTQNIENKKIRKSLSMSDVSLTKIKALKPMQLQDSSSSLSAQDEINDRLAQFSTEFDLALEQDVEKLSAKYLLQIEGYQKKGVNALTKKLIEKVQNEMAKVVDRRREDAFAEKQAKMDAIRAGLL